jgi:hypothetical protein
VAINLVRHGKLKGGRKGNGSWIEEKKAFWGEEGMNESSMKGRNAERGSWIERMEVVL